MLLSTLTSVYRFAPEAVLLRNMSVSARSRESLQTSGDGQRISVELKTNLRLI